MLLQTTTDQSRKLDGKGYENDFLIDFSIGKMKEFTLWFFYHM